MKYVFFTLMLFLSLVSQVCAHAHETAITHRDDTTITLDEIEQKLCAYKEDLADIQSRFVDRIGYPKSSVIYDNKPRQRNLMGTPNDVTNCSMSIIDLRGHSGGTVLSNSYAVDELRFDVESLAYIIHRG